MISIHQALLRLNQVRPQLGIERLALAHSLGRTLAEPIYAPIDLPPFSRSAMDGYALRSHETDQAPLLLDLKGKVAAGEHLGSLERQSAVRIFTGAPLPDGADAVIEQEAVREDPIRHQVKIERPVAVGRNVMAKAHQYAQGDRVYAAGQRLGSVHVGTLAALGITTVSVFCPIRVALVQTGNELTPGGHPLGRGSIYEVQAIWLPLVIRQWGGTLTQLVRVGDDLPAIAQAIETVSSHADLVLTSGGISVGDYDFVAQALENVAHPLFWRVAMHPGRAVAAAHRDQTLILALSGNPQAALTSWSTLAGPWWAAIQKGRLQDQRGRYPLLQAYPKPTRETRLLRVRRLPEGLDAALPHSADILSDPWNSGYALVPQGSPPLASGTMLTYWQPSGLGGTAPSWQGTDSDDWPFSPPAEFGEATDSL